MRQFCLETPRLRLRELEPSDIDFVAEMLGDAEVMRYYRKTLSRDESTEWIERQRMRYAHDGHALWLVSERESGNAVGQTGLVTMPLTESPDGLCHEIGYLLHRSYWGRGYATEAAAAVRDFAFTTHNQNDVVSLIRPDNEPSQAVARRLGMTVRGETIHADLPHLVFGITRGREELTSHG